MRTGEETFAGYASVTIPAVGLFMVVTGLIVPGIVCGVAIYFVSHFCNQLDQKDIDSEEAAAAVKAGQPRPQPQPQPRRISRANPRQRKRART